MKSFVNDILAPYFDKKKDELGLPPSQKSLWQIDVWLVHRSKEFRGWMGKNHPNIILDYVPGGCTSVHQPCDVGIQRPLKFSMRKSYHEDIVYEIMSELNNGNTSPSLKEPLGVIGDQSVQWMWNVYNTVNNKVLNVLLLAKNKHRLELSLWVNECHSITCSFSWYTVIHSK